MGDVERGGTSWIWIEGSEYLVLNLWRWRWSLRKDFGSACGYGDELVLMLVVSGGWRGGRMGLGGSADGYGDELAFLFGGSEKGLPICSWSGVVVGFGFGVDAAW